MLVLRVCVFFFPLDDWVDLCVQLQGDLRSKEDLEKVFSQTRLEIMHALSILKHHV